MVPTLPALRQRLVRELVHVNRAIAATRKRMSEIQARMAELSQAKSKAA